MLNDINVENSWESLRCKFQLKQITKSKKKCRNQWKLQSEKNGLKISNPSFNPLQISILEQAKVHHEMRQFWFSTR